MGAPKQGSPLKAGFPASIYIYIYTSKHLINAYISRIYSITEMAACMAKLVCLPLSMAMGMGAHSNKLAIWLQGKEPMREKPCG